MALAPRRKSPVGPLTPKPKLGFVCQGPMKILRVSRGDP